MRTIVPLFFVFVFALPLQACLSHTMVVRGGVEMSQQEAAQAELAEAKALEAARDFEAAAERYESVARQYPRSSLSAEALYRAGRSWEAVGQKLRARAAYERILEVERTSPFVPQARERLDELGDADLDRALAAYEQLPEGQRHGEATRLAVEAEEAGSGAIALHWRKEAVHTARTPTEEDAATRELEELIGRLSPIEIEPLVRKEPRDSIAAPVLAHRLAMLHHEQRDWVRLEEALEGFVYGYPHHPLAEEARELLEKIGRRGEVDPLAIGVVLPLSGDYQAYGQQLLAGIELAMEGSPFRLVVRDDKGDALEAEAVVERLLYEDRVMAIIGGVLQDEAQSVAGTADELGIPSISFSPTLSLVDESSWVFRDMLTNEAVAEKLARYVVEEKGLTRVAILHPEMPYGEEMKALFEEKVLELGGEIRHVQSYPHDATSFSEPIRSLVGTLDVREHPEYHQRLGEIRAQNLDARRRRNAIERMHQSLSPQVDFDVLFVPDQWRTISLVAPALAFEDVVTNWCDDWEVEKAQRTTGHRVKPVMLLGVNLWNHPELPIRGGKYVNCSMFADGFFLGTEREETQRFVAAFQSRHRRAPGWLEAYAAEAGAVLRYVMELEAPQTRRALRDALAGAEGVPGPMGTAWVNERGEVSHDLFLLTIDEGEIREGEPGQDEAAEAIP